MRKAVIMVGLGVVLALAFGPACSSDPERHAALVSGPTTPPDGIGFCDVLQQLPADTPESYVGSPQHLADVEALLAVAPESTRPSVETYRAFVASGAITSDPAANLRETWPTEVQNAISVIQAYGISYC